MNQDDEIKRCQTERAERAEVVKKHNLVSPRQAKPTFNFSKFASPRGKDKVNVNQGLASPRGTSNFRAKIDKLFGKGKKAEVKEEMPAASGVKAASNAVPPDPTPNRNTFSLKTVNKNNQMMHRQGPNTHRPA